MLNNPERFIDVGGMSGEDPNSSDGDRKVNYVDVQDKNGKVTRVWDYADNKDNNGNAPNTQEGTGAAVGDHISMSLSGAISTNETTYNDGDGDKKPKANDKTELTKQYGEVLEKADVLKIEFEYGKSVISSEGIMTFSTKNGIIKVVSTAAKYEAVIKTLGWMGYMGNAFSAIYDYGEYESGQISGARLSCRMSGIVASIGAEMLTGALVGSEVGPWGTVAGVVVGATFGVGEIIYDQGKPLINSSINKISSMENSFRSGDYKWIFSNH